MPVAGLIPPNACREFVRRSGIEIAFRTMIPDRATATLGRRVFRGAFVVLSPTAAVVPLGEIRTHWSQIGRADGRASPPPAFRFGVKGSDLRIYAHWRERASASMVLVSPVIEIGSCAHPCSV